MNISNSPKKQPVPFGINGQREDLLSITPAGNNQASYDAGFPAITMLLKSAGGLPPKGQDMNQILYELANIARWSGAGGNYQFDSVFATAISGYPAGAKVLASDSSGFWLNQTDGNLANPEAPDYTLTGWVPVEQSGYTVISGLAAASVTLSSLQAAKDVITLSGTLTANINLILPAWKKKWKIVNNCTGSFTVTVKTFAGTGQAIPSGQEANIRCDGTNISYAELNTKSLLSEINALGSASIATALANLSLVNSDGSVGRLGSIQRFTASGTYTPSTGVKKIIVEVVGAGGGGAGAPAGSSSSNSVGGGGGGGAYAKALIATLATSYTITIGTGGAGGTTWEGASGGSTTFGSLITCGGGNGGYTGTASGASNAAGGGFGANAPTVTGVTVILSMGGGFGQPGYMASGWSGNAGNGASSRLGNGGFGSANGAGSVGGGYGSGGGGALTTTTNTTQQNGGAGAPGIVIIYEYY